jgi:hypothetical protein
MFLLLNAFKMFFLFYKPNAVSMSRSKPYDYAWKHPLHCLAYNHGLHVMCKVEFFVAVLPANYFISDVVSNGTVLEVRTRIPNHRLLHELEQNPKTLTQETVIPYFYDNLP